MTLLRTVARTARRLARAAGALAAGHGLAGTAAAQQASPCRAADSTSVALIRDVVRYTAATEPAYVAARNAMRYPSVPASQVTLVTTKNVCTKAADAYARTINVGAARLSGRVYVVQAGTTYTVLDPAYYYSKPGIWTRFIFDSQWRLLAER